MADLFRSMSLAIITVSIFAAGCTGTNTFSTAVRAGDTILLTLGWNPNLTKEQLTVTVTPAIGSPVTLTADDPEIRVLANLYPDPLSRLIVERESGTSTDPGYLFSHLMEYAVTGADKDFSQKILIMDVPAGISTGTATISFTNGEGDVSFPQTVEILPGVGVRNNFWIQESDQLALGGQLVLGERASHYAVSFTAPEGTDVPYAIQVDLEHTPGIGNPYVVSPRGNDIKSASWYDNGSNLRVILMPTGPEITDLVNFKFYVAGGLDTLQLAPGGVKAFNSSGDEIPDIDATVTFN